jgi:hypothetical protein
MNNDCTKTTRQRLTRKMCLPMIGEEEQEATDE